MSTVVVICLLLLIVVLLVGYKTAGEIRRGNVRRKGGMKGGPTPGADESPLSKRTRITLIKPDDDEDAKSP